MKRVFIIHGWGGNPDEPMLKWLRKSLETKGYEVIAPFMPNPNVPTISAWVNHIVEVIKNPDEDTVLIGHSVGCQAILRYLQIRSKEEKVDKVILIAPWIIPSEDIEEDEDPEIARPWMEIPIDFENAKKHAKSFYGVFSDDDYSVPLIENGNLLKEKLGAKTIVLENKGHFTEGDGVVELPEVLKIINS